MTEGLRKRIAEKLGWTVEETYGFSLRSLREVVRPVSEKLAYELTREIESGRVVTR